MTGAVLSQSPQLLAGQRVLVTGAGGQVGVFLVDALRRVGALPIAAGHRPSTSIDLLVDISDPAAMQRAFQRYRPDMAIHLAAMTDVDGCERDPASAYAINSVGCKNVAQAAQRVGAWMLSVSTDFVFSGDDPPYDEYAATDPVSIYGDSKLRGEQAVLETNSDFAIARTAWIYGGLGKHFPRTVLTVLSTREYMDVVNDERGCPTFAGDLAGGLVALARLRPSGLFHLTNGGSASRYELAQAVASGAGLDPERIRPISRSEFLTKFPLPARRPADSTLSNIRGLALGVVLPSWETSLGTYMPQLASEIRCSA